MGSVDWPHLLLKADDMMEKINRTFLVVLLVLSFSWLKAASPLAQAPKEFTRTTKKGDLSYLITLPNNYRQDTQHKSPLLLFLHGGDGSNTRHNPRKYAPDPDLPLIILAPQAPSGGWSSVDFNTLLKEVSAEYNVDPDRIYLTGYSMGGYGVWDLLSRNPEWFAAAVPIAGGGDAERICKAKNVSVWAIHGDQDDVIPHSESEKMINALKKCGADAQLTLYPGVKHPSWIQAYKDPAFYKWLLNHRKKSRS